MTMLKVQAIGRLGKEPEMRFTPSGQAVTNLSVATDRKYTGQDGQLKKETIWLKVSVWGKQAEACSTYLHKGNQVYIEGRLVGDAKGGPKIFTRTDGTPGASFEISASDVKFIGGKSEGSSEGEAEETAVSEEEIPFA